MLKRIIAIILITTILFPIFALAEEESVKEVKLSQCVDSTSARFLLNEQEIKVKFIGIEADEFIETDSNDEINGKKVDDYVCSLLTNAKSIKIEYESNISLLDKYGRTNAWVFVDGELLESHLISLGYAKVAYLYDDYKYNDTLLEEEKEAKEGN
jgi:micrococcal nuclease